MSASADPGVRSVSRDFYEVLGVPRSATQEDIQRAYRRLARTYHPDLNPDPAAAERFKEITEAYNVLSDPKTRRRYDAFGEQFRQVPEDVDPDEWRAGQRARDREGAERGRGEAWWGRAPRGWRGRGFDLGDLLEDLFAGERVRPGWRPVRGPDEEADLELTLEEAYRGGRRTVTVTGPEGRHTHEVTIPPGVVEGQRIRLPGLGPSGGPWGAAPGDLYLVVRLRPDPRYRVRGRDVTVDLPLAPWEAALGARVPVQTPTGEVTVRVPPGTSSGRKLRLRGRGLPNPGGRPGELYAEVRVVVPRRLTERQRRLFEELAATGFDPRGQSDQSPRG